MPIGPWSRSSQLAFHPVAEGCEESLAWPQQPPRPPQRFRWLSFIADSAPTQAPVSAHQLVRSLRALGGVAGHAVADVIVEQSQGDALQRCLGRLDLGQHIDAVAV